MENKTSPAVILLSGGLDSATVLAVALRNGFACHALAFDYGQRHCHELEAAAAVAAQQKAASFRTMPINLAAFGHSALTDPSIDVPEAGAEGIPVTYVPARNTVFLSLSLAYAETLGAQDIFIGVNSQDYSGYPDCRPAFIQAFENLARLGTRAGAEGAAFRIHAPLQYQSKAEIIRLGSSLGVDYGLTRSCYNPDGAGRACGRCDSCRLRALGFAAAGFPDPTPYQPDA
ncbi:7-cyano-7-deazaguanine synthase QueC [Thermithiobacillus tepidarius DSM 3134]|uniref:7-cyano-7-deazaguanine synthase QueC n=1 Tax=Thermithiobacillus tepidarius TaxID=929 RepID=UPI00040E31A6|nr:7-cyano-7-deazaguanine synthase QueC [Thermithiobacillus tepidarius]